MMSQGVEREGKKIPSGQSVRHQIDAANIAERAEPSGEGSLLQTENAFL